MTFKKKLIEVALPLAAINAESIREKSIRHGHPSTLHLWWARRPLAAARAVLWASLVDDPSGDPERFPSEEDQQLERKRLFGILERLVPWEAASDDRILAEAHAEIERSCGTDWPTILDPFGGGGSIPLEAIRLGLKTYTGDLNPVAVLIQRAMLEIPGQLGGRSPVDARARSSQAVWEGTRGIASDVEAYGERMLDEARRRIGKYYPDALLPGGARATPIAWIWARTVNSPDPSWSGHVPLVGSWVLSKKPGKPIIWIDPIVERSTRAIAYVIRTGGPPREPTVIRGNGICLATGTTIPGDYIKAEAMAGRMRSTLLAIVAEGVRGRIYVAPTTDQLETDVPVIDPPISGPVPRHLTGGTCAIYGLDDWGKLFTDRQLLALTTFSKVLEELGPVIEADARAGGFRPDGKRFREGGNGARAYADAIVTYLAFIVDRVVSRWNTLSIWNTIGEKIEHVFRLQALPMTWSFAEANPFSNSSGGWSGQIEWVAKAVTQLPVQGVADTAQRDASSRIREVGRSVIATDPPYYDNISYADLSDLFFVWLRQNVKDVWPDECATLLTPKQDELIANRYRAGSAAAAQRHFEDGMLSVFREAREVADDRFPATIFYAFKASETTREGVTSTGWELFLRALFNAGYVITATWPIRTERSGGVKGGKSMLASSIVLACRPRPLEAALATRSEFIGALRSEMPPAIRLLQTENIAPVDLAQSAMGPGIAVFSRYARVVESDGAAMTVRAALSLINEVLAEVLSGEESEFDAATRFALTWFDQFGHNPGPFGDADQLARAKNTTVAGIVSAGIAINREGTVRLAERVELSDSWRPETDQRLTVWEITQYMIRALEVSEMDAAYLLSRVGLGMGERARQLAYLVYGICDRRRWPDEAVAYNMLVTAWPEVSRLSLGTAWSEDRQSLF